MIPFAVSLDNLDFDALVEIARSRLPVLAPDWTDYNYSDPGITLVELLCWVADTQIYSLARNRQDERAAMAALLGIVERGAKPAAGTLFPDPETHIAAATTIEAGTRLVAAGSGAPRLEVAHAVTLHPVEIQSITVTAHGTTVDRTAANAEPHDTFAPFGRPPSRDAMLALRLKGPLDKGDTVSIGFQLERDAAVADRLGGIAVSQWADGAEIPIAPEDITDTSDGFKRSGAVLLTLPHAPDGRTTELRFRARTNALMPRLLRIGVNALPVVQRATIRQQRFAGTGRPGQVLLLDPQACLPAGEPAPEQAWRLTREPEALSVEVEEDGKLAPWRPAMLADANSDARCFEMEEQSDGRGIGLRFGNGVNGRRVPEGAEILVSAEVSAGSRGTVRASLQWLLDGARTLWRNDEPIDGGEDADDLESLLVRMRTRLRDGRPLTSSADIAAAARALSPAYGIARAAVEEGWEPGRRRPATAATRTLLVTRDPQTSETPAWLRAIRGELAPRMPIGERLVVAVPEWRRFGVRIRASAAQRRLPREVERAIRDCLAARLPPGDSGKPHWPLGRDVTASELGGWIRRIEGVGAVSEASLVDEHGRPVEGGVLSIGRGALPLLDETLVDVAVSAGGGQ
jgi:hypothetical protein